MSVPLWAKGVGRGYEELDGQWVVGAGGLVWVDEG